MGFCVEDHYNKLNKNFQIPICFLDRFFLRCYTVWCRLNLVTSVQGMHSQTFYWVIYLKSPVSSKSFGSFGRKTPSIFKQIRF